MSVATLTCQTCLESSALDADASVRAAEYATFAAAHEHATPLAWELRIPLHPVGGTFYGDGERTPAAEE